MSEKLGAISVRVNWLSVWGDQYERSFALQVMRRDVFLYLWRLAKQE